MFLHFSVTYLVKTRKLISIRGSNVQYYTGNYWYMCLKDFKAQPMYR